MLESDSSFCADSLSGYAVCLKCVMLPSLPLLSFLFPILLLRYDDLMRCVFELSETSLARSGEVEKKGGMRRREKYKKGQKGGERRGKNKRGGMRMQNRYEREEIKIKERKRTEKRRNSSCLSCVMLISFPFLRFPSLSCCYDTML